MKLYCIFVFFLKLYIVRAKCTKSIPKEILFELETPNVRFSDRTINYFINLVRATTKFDMIDVIFYYFPELYTKCESDDVQILYGGDIGINATGHFLCVLYENNTVYVYDSLFKKELHERQLEIINNRYPDRKLISFVEPKIKQLDDISCGPFAIAYATTLILNADPSKYEYETDLNGSDVSYPLKKHIRKMFECYELDHFPRIRTRKTDL